MSAELIPFGKYSGQPVEMLAEDHQYADWLIQQPWFRQKYANLYSVVINNFQTPNETPEHNALQARFLDDEFCRKMAALIFPKRFPITSESLMAALALMAEETLRKFPFRLHTPFLDAQLSTEQLGDDLIVVKIQALTGDVCPRKQDIEEWFRVRSNMITISRKEFENARGVDVRFMAESATGEFVEFDVERKPSVGDDYPAVLRQMKRSGARILVFRTFSSAAISREQLGQIFRCDNIRVVSELEIDRLCDSIPPVDLRQVASIFSRPFQDRYAVNGPKGS